jgi:hypothetical protein
MTNRRTNNPIRVVNKKTHKGEGVYIGRPSVLGNPFSHLTGTLAEFRVDTRDEAIDMYGEWIIDHIQSESPQRREIHRLVEIYERTGSLTLICCCAPKRCHGDVLARVIMNVIARRQRP